MQILGKKDRNLESAVVGDEPVHLQYDCSVKENLINYVFQEEYLQRSCMRDIIYRI